ncbi:TetR/AcrR family transcriptional regulator [Brachybacterium alimentarium]|uniref:TetR/AcrR family transcriptional regulator n=1 Tax=Brachybacterium alimentarium TaxID=47845 RepID=UPI003FB9D102
MTAQPEIDHTPGLRPQTDAVDPSARRNPPARRDTILDGASELFAEYGFYGASVRDIARHVGISHPGMLHHFASKSALLDGVIDRLEASAQATLDQMDELCAQSESLVERMVALYDPSSRSFALLSMLSAESVAPDYPARYRISRLRRVHEHILQRCVEHYAERVGLSSQVDAELIARTAMSLILGHAAREESVRRMQDSSHHDDPSGDLRSFLLLSLEH